MGQAATTTTLIEGGPAAADAPGVAWRVIQTRARQEKALARTLAAAGIRHELPLIRKPAWHGGWKRVVEAPLFPSYLFVHGPREDAFFAVGTKRATRIIEATDQTRLERELDQIRRAIAGDAPLDPYPYLTTGRSVRVSGGPFKGLEGVVEDRTSVDRLVLGVSILGRAVALTIDASLLEPIDG